MTERKWTPGPLTCGHRGTASDIRNGRDYFRVEAVRDVRDVDAIAAAHCFGPNKEANANLFAAAPELYDALEEFVNEYVELVESGDAGFWDAEEEPKVIKARAALAKARGEA